MEVGCAFVDIKWSGRELYTCYVKTASITEPGTIIRNFKGKHKASNVDSSVEGFVADKCTIKYFPIKVNSFFRNLKHLAIDSCGLVSLSRKDLNGLEGLELISFRNNELTSLPSDLFVGFCKLKSIKFSLNKLEVMSSKLLDPIIQNELDFVCFHNNKKIDACYNRGKKEGMTLKLLMDTIDEKCKIVEVDQVDLTKMPKRKPGFNIDDFDESIVQSFAHLWETKVFSDFKIVTKDSKEIPIHKCVLGVRSSVFAAAFNTDMEEKRMVIDRFSPEAVEQFLQSFYTGRIPNDLHTLELFALAAQFDVAKLKTKCEEAALRNLDETKAFEIFSLGHLHSSEDMKEKGFGKIKESMPDHLLNDNLKNDPEKLRIIVDAARERARLIQAAEDSFKMLRNDIEEAAMPKADVPGSSEQSGIQEESQSTN